MFISNIFYLMENATSFIVLFFYPKPNRQWAVSRLYKFAAIGSRLFFQIVNFFSNCHESGGFFFSLNHVNIMIIYVLWLYFEKGTSFQSLWICLIHFHWPFLTVTKIFASSFFQEKEGQYEKKLLYHIPNAVDWVWFGIFL